MKYPKLVPKRLCNTTVRVLFSGNLNIEGLPEKKLIYDGKCNLLNCSKTVFTSNKREQTIEAVALFDGDIAPYMQKIAGDVTVSVVESLDCESGEMIQAESSDPLLFDTFGDLHQIFRGTRAHNPDGSVNYTKLELI